MKKAFMIFASLVCVFSGFVLGRLTYQPHDSKLSSETNAKTVENSTASATELSGNEVDNALRAYEEFLSGTRKAGEYDIDSIMIPKGEPNSRYFTKYAFFDSSGDGMPELHVKSARYYFIFTFKQNEVVFWSSVSAYAEPLNNRAFLTTRYSFASTTESHGYSILDCNGKEVFQIGFSVYDTNENGIYEENDEYGIRGATVSKEAYDILTNPYMSIGSDLIEWTVLCETIN